MSVYNFTEIKKYLYGNKKHKSFSFEKNHAKANEWCEFSYVGNAGDIGALKPGGSFQSMDLSNMTKEEDKWYLYICGGNEAKKGLEGCPFVEIKRGCLVNVAKIDKIKGGIISIGGEQLQISKRKQSEVTHAYLAYYKEA